MICDKSTIWDDPIIDNNRISDNIDNFTSLDNNGTSSHKSIRLYCSHCGYFKDLVLKCSDRTCVNCRKRTYFKLIQNWKNLAAGMKNPKLLTLTTVNTKVLTKKQLLDIRANFNKLMRRKYYREKIEGGIYAIEINNSGRGWHVHIHALIDTKEGQNGYMIQGQISKDWFNITEDSMIVDVRKVYDTEKGLNYILKYLLKQPETCGDDYSYNMILKGTRLIQTFGKFYCKKNPRANMVCPCCEHTDWLTEEMLFYPESAQRRQLKGMAKRKKKEKLKEDEIFKEFLNSNIC